VQKEESGQGSSSRPRVRLFVGGIKSIAQDSRGRDWEEWSSGKPLMVGIGAGRQHSLAGG
jgi:hypothetical protein